MNIEKSINLQKTWGTLERNQDILDAVNSGVPQAEVAKKYGVTRQCINQLIKRHLHETVYEKPHKPFFTRLRGLLKKLRGQDI